MTSISLLVGAHTSGDPIARSAWAKLYHDYHDRATFGELNVDVSTDAADTMADSGLTIDQLPAVIVETCDGLDAAKLTVVSCTPAPQLALGNSVTAYAAMEALLTPHLRS